MTTADLRRDLPHLYRAGAQPVLVDVPPLDYLMIDGHGDPNTAPQYAEAVQALYTLAFTLRFALKRQPDPVDAPVMPLEGLWWVSDMTAFSVADKSTWDWTMMIALSAPVSAERVAEARDAAARKKQLPGLERVRLERLAEGRAAQVLHRGPYSAEGTTVAALHAFIDEQGLALTGKHHEIYLGDPRRTAPERLRTIIRQPAAPAAV